MNNNQLAVILVMGMFVFFGCDAYIQGTNLRTIVTTCKESR